MELPNFLGQEFSITVQYGLLVPGGCGGDLALRPPGALAEGTISPAVLGTVAGWTALQVSPWLNGRKPQVLQDYLAFL